MRSFKTECQGLGKHLSKLLFTTLTITKNGVWLETEIDWFIKMTLVHIHERNGNKKLRITKN